MDIQFFLGHEVDLDKLDIIDQTEKKKNSRKSRKQQQQEATMEITSTKL